jgi:hypothetical protein
MKLTDSYCRFKRKEWMGYTPFVFWVFYTLSKHYFAILNLYYIGTEVNKNTGQKIHAKNTLLKVLFSVSLFSYARHARSLKCFLWHPVNDSIFCFFKFSLFMISPKLLFGVLQSSWSITVFFFFFVFVLRWNNNTQ